MKKSRGKVLSSLLLIALVLTMLWQPVHTSAADDDSSSQTGNITVRYPVVGVTFSLYKIGTVNSKGGYNLYKKYSAYKVDMTNKNAASTLADYVTGDNLTADYTAVSDSSGGAYFRNLKKGAYLLIGQTIVTDNVKFVSQSVIISVPQNGDEYDILIDGKFEEEETDDTEISVTKVWKNDSSSSRPTTITVELLQDGSVVDEAVLSKSNDWTKEWVDLDGNSNWTVREKSVPSGYKVVKTTSGTKIILTNTKSGGSGGGGGGGGNLPQTGQLWWPVGILAALGLFFILLGLLVNGRRG